MWIKIRRCNPTIFSLIIPIFGIFLLWFWLGSVYWFPKLVASLLFLGCWVFFARLLFPRIVITIMELDDVNSLLVLAEGKPVLKEKDGIIPLPIQFSFQVWRKDKYDLCLRVKHNETGKIKSFIKEANTYEHMVCHVVFD